MNESKLTRVFFDDYRKYKEFSSYDLINENFDSSIKINSEEETNKKNVSVEIGQFEDSRELLQHLNIDYSQQLSYIAQLCNPTPFIEYCLNYENFQNKPNHIRYCAFIKYPKYKRKFEQSYFVNDSSKLNKIESIQVTAMVIVVFDQEEQYKDKIEGFLTELDNFVRTEEFWYDKNKLKFCCFDNESSVITEVFTLKDKITKIKSEKSFSGQYDKIQINILPNKAYVHLEKDKNVLEEVQRIKKSVETLLNKFSMRKLYLDEKSENCHSQIEKIKETFSNKLAALIIRQRNRKQHSELDITSELGLYESVVKHLNICEEKFRWIDLFESQNIKYFRKNETPKFNNDNLIFCYTEEEKENNLGRWSSFIGTITTYNIKKLKKVFVCNKDIIEARILPKKMGIYEYTDGEFKEFSYDLNHQQNQNNERTEEEMIIEDIENIKPNYDEVIQKKIDSPKPILTDDITILLLGESGVGKSTFINAFFNYVAFRSLEDAENANEVVHKIGSRFTYTDENYKVCTVNIGDDDTNECDFVGQSSTQYAKAHEIRLKNGRILRIIDTPGMGDTRGIKVDQENFKNTVEYISQFPYLNAICFLMKPNNARFGPIFKYCFKELFSNLHKDATKNIFFCFTNSRSTSYRPGDTLPALNNFLQEIKDASNVDIETSYENMFCFDNEAFRYLIITKNGLINPSPEDKLTFKRSWDKSSSEANRLLDSIDLKKVLDIKDIVVVNKSKTFLIDWSEEIIDVLSDLIKCQLKVASIMERFENDLSKVELSTCHENIEKLILKIINYMALITTYLQQNSIVVFNDSFYAALSEHISKCEKSEYVLKAVDLSLPALKEVRSLYKVLINEKSEERIKENDYDKKVDELRNKIINDAKDLLRNITEFLTNF